MRPSVWLCGPFCLIAVGIVAYDAYTLVTGGRKDATENTLNLALDVVPFGKLRYA